MPNLIIIGAGGFGLEVAAYAEAIAQTHMTDLQIRGFLDDTKPIGTKHAGYSVLADTQGTIDADAVYVIALGNPAARQQLAERITSKGGKFVTLIHPSSCIASTASIGTGTILAPFTLAGPEVKIGKHCLFNVYACAGHEAVMGDYCVFSPYASIHGTTQLGGSVFLGGQAFVTARVKVGDRAKISAGAVVYSDIPADTLAMGNPAAFRQNG